MIKLLKTPTIFKYGSIYYIQICLNRTNLYPLPLSHPSLAFSNLLIRNGGWKNSYIYTHTYMFIYP